MKNSLFMSNRVKCIWKEGQNVYLVSDVESARSFGTNILLNDLGKKYTINKISWNSYGGQPKLKLNPINKSQLSGLFPIHPNDISKENTFVNDFEDAPEYIKEMANWDDRDLRDTSCYFDSHYALYISEDKSKENCHTLPSILNEYEEMDPCEDCEDGNCDDCTETGEVVVDMSKPLKGFINTNTGCWQDAMSMWKAVKSNWNKNPDTMAVLLNSYDINISPLTNEDILEFWQHMKYCKALPYNIKLPTLEEFKDDAGIILKLDVTKISQERMYWYFCTLRLPAYWPQIVKATLHCIRKGNMEPLLAYVMGHACAYDFEGGHAVLDPTQLRLVRLCRGDTPSPLMDIVMETAVRCHKFLTTKTIPYITDKDGKTNDWRLNRHVQRYRSRYPLETRLGSRSTAQKLPNAFDTTFRTVKGVTPHNLHTFSSKERKLKAA